jgi:hypothetical protein
MDAATQARVELEKEELGTKLSSLEFFLQLVPFKGLDSRQQHLLQEQVQAMAWYYDILAERLVGRAKQDPEPEGLQDPESNLL